jgi:Methyltransferase domain
LLSKAQLQAHRLNFDDAIFREILDNPAAIGLSPEDLAGKEPAAIKELVLGEYFALLAAYTGKVASELLMQAEWGHRQPDWFDHRHHLLNPEKYFTDFWAMSADNVIEVLPLDGRVLNLCAGDAFYDYHFFRHRAAHIECVDINPAPHRVYLRHHQAKNITYTLGDVLALKPEDKTYDVVIIRGAIEHFSRESQQKIFTMARQALKIGGWFCGDTPSNRQHDKLLSAHECEWADETEMRRELVCVFDHVQTRTLKSRERETLFWQCQRTR